ncbi:myotrophin-like [Mercenaria mercenaria]|uniref:myotrophin-like n=1 Tax=Mercenaria mercenaria TaxID=6596 RepID=UPI00234F8EAC|nr:myotrophin-like [Mercenaria mercenaria]
MSDDQSLVWGVKNGEVEVVTRGIKDMKDVNKEILNGRNALHFAADYGQTDVIKCLIDAGADVNKPDKYGISPLLAAIYEGHTDAAKLLLENGANKDGEAPDGQKYIECAETDDMKALLKK